MATTTAIKNIGKIVQVIGPVLDVEFEAEHLPELYNALEITGKAATGEDIRVIAEVQQHIGRNQVRAVAMSSTDGTERGFEVVDTGGPITVPVGRGDSHRALAGVCAQQRVPGARREHGRVLQRAAHGDEERDR